MIKVTTWTRSGVYNLVLQVESFSILAPIVSTLQLWEERINLEYMFNEKWAIITYLTQGEEIWTFDFFKRNIIKLRASS